MLHQETITRKMHDIASVIYYQFDVNYYLAGGTSIALLLGHRESVDLDYCIQKDIDTNTLKNTIKEIWSSVIFTYEEKNTLWCDIEGVKVSFTTRKDTLIESVVVEDVFRMASLSDSVVMKLTLYVLVKNTRTIMTLLFSLKKVMWEHGFYYGIRYTPRVTQAKEISSFL